ncbi:hypothetical protein CVS47_01799 [Microbacterium lemovicicum]|uniref:Integral membrane protein n=1 Tax=Microbacterium lemovicicum TaxID=1072463 RepID=A0A3Q9IZ20_9MICO|nr:hypothetical protein [Microbacterium lemovicicum]AZS37168.1 hypothetical protein CVS47_01799 [Microbacterium lemovicicum]
MHIALAVILFANALFNIVAWPQFLRRVAKDPRTRDDAGSATAFLRVHVVLVVIALALAAASLIGGVVLLAAG